MTIIEFLLARFDEDEAEVTAKRDHNEGCFPDMSDCQSHYGEDGQWSWGPARVLAECVAKRRIVGIYTDLWMSEPDEDYPSVPLGGNGPETYYEALQHLASVYSDHPDYDEAWRP